MELCIITPTLNENDNIEHLIRALQQQLAGIDWELIVVDDNSGDGTADRVRKIGKTATNIRCLHRINRYGLSSACVEGMLATNADYIAVIDADLQHDESLLPQMLHILKQKDAMQIAIGSRYIAAGSTGTMKKNRVKISHFSNKLASFLLHNRVSDPMSGFFMLNRALFNYVLPKLSQIGFKILLDILASSPKNIVVHELAYHMRKRKNGDSKLDVLVSIEYLMLLLDKFTPWLPWRFIIFVLVGCSGLLLHLCILYGALLAGLGFVFSHIIATLIAIGNNYYWNNIVTYRDKKRKGVLFYTGLFKFYCACSVGAIINVQMAIVVYEASNIWWLSAVIGSILGSVWNFAVNNYLTWNK